VIGSCNDIDDFDVAANSSVNSKAVKYLGVTGAEPRLATRQIRNLTAMHHNFRRNALNMIPSENVTSPSPRELVVSDFMRRYSEYEQHNIKTRCGAEVVRSFPFLFLPVCLY
jgi:hypothetical protein